MRPPGKNQAPIITVWKYGIPEKSNNPEILIYPQRIREGTQIKSQKENDFPPSGEGWWTLILWIFSWTCLPFWIMGPSRNFPPERRPCAAGLY
jgi:hypothetical protein